MPAHRQIRADTHRDQRIRSRASVVAEVAVGELLVGVVGVVGEAVVVAAEQDPVPQHLLMVPDVATRTQGNEPEGHTVGGTSGRDARNNSMSSTKSANKSSSSAEPRTISDTYTQ